MTDIIEKIKEDKNRDHFKKLGPGGLESDIDVGKLRKISDKGTVAVPLSAITKTDSKSKKKTVKQTRNTKAPSLDTNPADTRTPEEEEENEEYEEEIETSPTVAVQWVYGELAQPRGDNACWDEFYNHLGWYTASGAVLAFTTWPIVKPVQRLVAHEPGLQQSLTQLTRLEIL